MTSHVDIKGKTLLITGGTHGKLDPGLLENLVKRRTDIHYPKPKVVSVTQATELGTVYTPQELGAIGSRARSLGLKVHMDGARFANACDRLGVCHRDRLRALERLQVAAAHHRQRAVDGAGLTA